MQQPTSGQQEPSTTQMPTFNNASMTNDQVINIVNTTTTTTHQQVQDTNEILSKVQLYYKQSRSRRAKRTLIAAIPRWKKVEDKHNTVQNILSAERTHLAWVRTGLAFTTLGVAVVRLFQSNNNIHVLYVSGSFFIALGLVCVLYSAIRYILVISKIESGVFSVDTVSPYLFGLFAIVSTVFAFLIIFYK